MADSIERLEFDKTLFQNAPSKQLMDLFGTASPRALAKAIRDIIELQIVTEELAKSNGIDIDEEMYGEYLDSHRGEIHKLVEKSITALICSVVSQEG